MKGSVVIECGAMDPKSKMLENLRLSEEEKALTCKVFTTRNINSEVFKVIMPKIWGLEWHVLFERVGKNTFLCRFRNPREKNKVVKGGLWCFDNALLLFEESKGINTITSLNFRFCFFWVHFYNLPLVCFCRKYAIGKYDGLEENEERQVEGETLRVKIKVDVQQPLKRGTNIKLGATTDEKWLPDTYEKLPDFCYRCGRLGHVVEECDMEEEEGDTERCYGVWLRDTHGRKGFYKGRKDGLDTRGWKATGRGRGRGRGGRFKDSWEKGENIRGSTIEETFGGRKPDNLSPRNESKKDIGQGEHPMCGYKNPATMISFDEDSMFVYKNPTPAICSDEASIDGKTNRQQGTDLEEMGCGPDFQPKHGCGQSMGEAGMEDRVVDDASNVGEMGLGPNPTQIIKEKGGLDLEYGGLETFTPGNKLSLPKMSGSFDGREEIKGNGPNNYKGRMEVREVPGIKKREWFKRQSWKRLAKGDSAVKYQKKSLNVLVRSKHEATDKSKDSTGKKGRFEHSNLSVEAISQPHQTP